MTQPLNPIIELAQLHRRIAEVYSAMAGVPAEPAPPAPRPVSLATPAAAAQAWRCSVHPRRNPMKSKIGSYYMCTAKDPDTDEYCHERSDEAAA